MHTRQRSVGEYFLAKSRSQDNGMGQRYPVLMVLFAMISMLANSRLLPASSTHLLQAYARNQTVIQPGITNLIGSDHPVPPVYASAAYLLDADTGETLYAKNATMHLSTFSTIKLMTALIAVEHGSLDQNIHIGPKIEQDLGTWLSPDSSLMGIKAGETYTLRELLEGLLLPSGNDAAIAIADAISGSVSNFVALMNQKAGALGMDNTHFANPHGLFSPNHYSSAHDLALLGRASLSNAFIEEISARKQITLASSHAHHAYDLLNGDQFLWWYPGVNGGKPGFDGVKNFNQVISCVRNGRHLIGVVLSTINWWTDMRSLMNYGFNSYTWVSPHDLDSPNHPIIYDNLWDYFASDTKNTTIPTRNNGRYYIYTGYSTSGMFQNYFDKHGGLQTFGFPIGMPQATDGIMMRQQFENSTIACDTQTQQCAS